MRLKKCTPKNFLAGKNQEQKNRIGNNESIDYRPFSGVGFGVLFLWLVNWPTDSISAEPWPKPDGGIRGRPTGPSFCWQPGDGGTRSHGAARPICRPARRPTSAPRLRVLPAITPPLRGRGNSRKPRQTQDTTTWRSTGNG